MREWSGVCCLCLVLLALSCVMLRAGQNILAPFQYNSPEIIAILVSVAMD